MSKKGIIFFGIAILFLLTNYEAPGQVGDDITLTITSANIQQLLPSQLDFQNFPNTIWLFTIKIEVKNPNQRDIRFINGNITAQLKDGEEIVLLEDGGFYSEPFMVDNAKTITNLDFGNSITIRNFKVTSEARNKIIEPALASGKIPSGTYTFDINVEDVNVVGAKSTKTFVLNIESPSQIELRSPREGEVTNEFPFFEWSYDGQEVELTINEKPPTMSREEAIGRLPIVFKHVYISANSFQYPPSGERPLQKGKTYVWRVVGKVRAASGYQNIESPLSLFKIEDDINIVKRSELLDRLERILGSKWQKVLDKVKEKELNPTEIFYLNNKQLSNAELEDVLNFLEQNSSSVEQVTID